MSNIVKLPQIPYVVPAHNEQPTAVDGNLVKNKTNVALNLAIFVVLRNPDISRYRSKATRHSSIKTKVDSGMNTWGLD